MPKQKIPLCKNRNKGHFVCILFTGNNEIFSDFCKEKYKETIMTVSDFLEYVKKHPLLSTEEIHRQLGYKRYQPGWKMACKIRDVVGKCDAQYTWTDRLSLMMTSLPRNVLISIRLHL